MNRLSVPRKLLAALLGISPDITERKLGEDRFRSLVQNSFDLITTIDAQGTIGYISPSVTRILGYSPSDLVGENAFVRVHPDDVDRLQSLFAEGLKEPGSTRQAEYRFRHADGSWVELWAVGTNLLHDASVQGVVVNSRDITQQKRDAKARAEAEIRYRSLVEQLASITYIAKLGLEGEWLYVSPQIEEMLGFTAEDWLADPKTWISRVHPEDRALVESAESATFSGGPFRAEYRMYRRDGQIIWVNDTASVMRDGEGNILLQGVMLDVTDRKQLETQLREAQKMQAVGRLAGGIAHDFNNMLTVITGYAQALLERRNPSEEAVRRGAEHIRAAADRAASLTRQLLAFGRKQMLEPRVVNLNSIVAEMDKLMRRFLAENIEVVLKPGRHLGAVKADPAQIEQVVLNLVINARDAMPEGGQLTVETANATLDQAYAGEHAGVRPGSYVMLAVSDTGIGMDAQTLDRVFEPFFTTKEIGKGTGLGLSTVYGIIQQSEGHICVYSVLKTPLSNQQVTENTSAVSAVNRYGRTI